MSKIVGVHGVGHQFRGANTIKKEWLPAINDGLDRSGRDPLQDADFEVAFYGDIFRPNGKGASVPPFDSKDVTDPWELEMLMSWWQEAARIQPSRVVKPSADTKVWVPEIVQRALDALSESSFFAGLAENFLIFDFKQTWLYLHNVEIRNRARIRLKDSIKSDTRVLIAHSLGSLVAYETLCANPDLKVEVFVTLGSPLGIRNLIFERLDPPPENGRGKWPGNIKKWVNIADSGDIVALVKELSKRFGPEVEDYRIHNGADAHDATRYFTTKELGDAIIFGL